MFGINIQFQLPRDFNNRIPSKDDLVIRDKYYSIKRKASVLHLPLVFVIITFKTVRNKSDSFNIPGMHMNIMNI